MTTFNADTTYGGDLQAALDAALAAGGGTVIGRATYAISVPLVIGSGVTLDLTGATVSAASQAHRMLRNASAQTGETGTTSGDGDPRDHDIALVGGTWTASGADSQTCRLVFNRVDGLTVRDLSIRATAGKFAMQISDATAFTVEDIAFAVASDGVHVTGPASDGTIRRIVGLTHDDFVALGCSDWETQDISRGDITDVLIEGIYPSNLGTTGNAVHLWTGGRVTYTDVLAMRRITVRDIRGTVGANGVGIDGFGATSEMSDVTISDVAVATNQAGYAAVVVGCASIITGLLIRRPHVARGSTGLTYGVLVSGYAYPLIDVDGLTASSSGRVIGCRVLSTASVGTLRVTNADLILPTVDSALTMYGGGNGPVTTLDTTGSVTRRNAVDFPAGYITDANAPAYVTGALLTAAGYAYAGTRLAYATRPYATGLDF